MLPRTFNIARFSTAQTVVAATVLLGCLVALAPSSSWAQSGSRGGGSGGGGGRVGGGSGGGGRGGGSARSLATRQRLQRTQQSRHAGASEPIQGFALVELFTSEGCSSCPAADANLARIAEISASRELDVYTLSIHVDYWNRLGWQDPYSAAWATARQEEYARLFKTKQIYTPQMIVNGTTPFVGSDQAASNTALNSALRIAPQSQLELAAALNGNQVNVSWKIGGTPAGELLNIALVQNSGTQRIDAGENDGRQLGHVNIVRQMKTVRLDESQRVALEIPQEFDLSDYHIVAFVQSEKDGLISAATKADISTN